MRDRITRTRRPWASGRARRFELVDDAGIVDDGVGLWWEGPRSATGEDVLELTLHGNPWIVERALAACVAGGARLAGPGEFTRRAVMNGRLDLVRAEAVDQLVRARSPEGVELARHAMSGALSAELQAVRGALVDAVAELEARLDHPGDALAEVDDGALVRSLGEIGAQCAERAASHTIGRRLIDGASAALVGGVNAGKSSLFNALLGERRALVHPTPGTTRDVVEARLLLGPLELTLLDTAGERETDDPVEAAGLALAAERIASVDLWIVVLRADGLDPAARLVLERSAGRPHLIVWNAIDRPDAGPAPAGAIPVSARTGHGLDGLRDALRRALAADPPERAPIASLRQAELLAQIAGACAESAAALEPAGPAVASEILLDALAAVDELTGADTREDVLDAVFARFCIGK